MDGKAYLIISKPCLFAIDINGQMDDQDTGRLPNDGHHSGYYTGPPIHTLTVFANAFLSSKPSLDDSGVHYVQPGEDAPSEGSWDTLYFLPGVHDVGPSFQLHTNRSYYIPGDAVVYGTMNNNKDGEDGELSKAKVKKHTQDLKRLSQMTQYIKPPSWLMHSN